MSRRFETTGADNWRQPVRPAMTEARRQHIHGRIEPMDEGKPCERVSTSTALLAGLLFGIAIALIVVQLFAETWH